MATELRFLLLLVAILMVFAGCRQTSGPAVVIRKCDTVFIHDTTFYTREPDDWQRGFGLTHEPDKDSVWYKPVSFYLNDKACSGLAQDFYYGFLRPSDNGTTAELLDLACTDNAKLRPFYRWCLTMTNRISDAALSEMTGRPSRRYTEKFPEEFFAYMESDTTGDRYKVWVGEILYSGQYDADDYRKPAAIRAAMVAAMRRNCRHLSPELSRKIEKFAADCFPDSLRDGDL